MIPTLPFRRFVLYVEEWGVYVGEFLGLGFWSKIDPVGQPCAVAFDTIDDAVAYVHTWKDRPPAYRTIEVHTRKPDRASIEECVAAGIPAWEADPEALEEEKR